MKPPLLIALSVLLGLSAFALGIRMQTVSYDASALAVPEIQPVLIGEVERVDYENRLLELKVARSNAVFPEEGFPVLSDKDFLHHRISVEPEVTVIDLRFDVRDGIVEGYRHIATSTAALSLATLAPGTIVHITGTRDEEGIFRANLIRSGEYVRAPGL